jgi:hypothetical protein
MATDQTPLLGGSAFKATSSKPKPKSGPAKPAPFDPNDDNLTKFRKAVGINVPYSSADDLESARKAATGIYKEVIDTRITRHRQYRFAEFIFYLALGAEIIIGATLTALGPISELHSQAITILGVVNTSTAGILALLKGQGLPDRLRKDGFEMRKVQDFIEETDIRLSLGDGTFTDDELDDVVQRVFLKYNAARDSTEMNRPESYGHQPEGDTQPRNSSGTTALGRNAVTDTNGKGKAQILID